jgi:general secretion pathway protein H
MVESVHIRAFTLIEMLVVLVIAGLFLALAVAIVQPDDKGRLRVEAERLAQLFDVASTESRLTGKTIGWTADAGGYRFWRLWEESRWRQIGEDEILRARTLPDGMTITGVRVENVPADSSARLEFAAYGAALSFVVEMSMGPARYAVLGSPVGEVRVVARAGLTGGETAQR